jgi:hypothetical protein
VSTATETKPDFDETGEEQGPTFDFTVEAAPPDYEPERKNPGRTRTPSPFDQTLLDVFGKGWQRVPHDGNDEKKQAIYRELTKAKSHTGVGLDLNETDTHIEFRSRELQKRAKRTSKNGQQELSENQDENDPDGDNDE